MGLLHLCARNSANRCHCVALLPSFQHYLQNSDTISANLSCVVHLVVGVSSNYFNLRIDTSSPVVGDVAESYLCSLVYNYPKRKTLV
jgi:hypothetical protein